MLQKIKSISFYIVVSIAIIAVIFFIAKGCNKPIPPVKQNTQVEDSLKNELSRSDAIIKQKSDSVRALKIVVDSLEEETVHAKFDLNEKVKETSVWKGKYNLAKIEKDTVSAITSCDSLVSVLSGDSLILAGYENLTDSLQTTYRKLSKAQDSSYTALNQAYFERQLVQQALEQDKNNLQTAYNKLAKRQKISSAIEKVGAIATAILTVIVLIKK